MRIEWTCSMCEQQVEDHQYDSDERMCEDCLNAEDLPDKMVKDFIQHRDTGDEHDFGETRNAQHFSEQMDKRSDRMKTNETKKTSGGLFWVE